MLTFWQGRTGNSLKVEYRNEGRQVVWECLSRGCMIQACSLDRMYSPGNYPLKWSVFYLLKD